MFAGNFPPNGWMFCEGQTLPISENEVLFQLIGTTYGGDGQETFNLPNMSSRLPIHFGTGPSGETYQIGEAAGTEYETLTVQQIPNHSHPMLVSTDQATSPNPEGNVLGAPLTASHYYANSPVTPLSNTSISQVGGSQPHENMQPYLCVNFIISLFGIFPSPT